VQLNNMGRMPAGAGPSFADLDTGGHSCVLTQAQIKAAKYCMLTGFQAMHDAALCAVIRP
jgi:hypothetical protein